jgi:hypothetical protein
VTQVMEALAPAWASYALFYRERVWRMLNRMAVLGRVKRIKRRRDLGDLYILISTTEPTK